MGRKKIVVVVAAVVLVLGAIGGCLIISSRNKEPLSKGESSSILTKEEDRGQLNYEDESGFSFKYPKEIIVKDTTPDDDTYYSRLELFKGKEILLISVKDTTVKTPEEWVKKDTLYKDATLVGAANMGGFSAKQYTNGNKLISVVIDKGVLYTIEGPKDNGYWEDVQNSVVSSFKLVTLEQSSGTSDSEVIYEEEEVVE